MLNDKFILISNSVIIIFFYTNKFIYFVGCLEGNYLYNINYMLGCNNSYSISLSMKISHFDIITRKV